MKKFIYILVLIISLLFCINVNAEVTVEKEIYSADGSMQFTFTGLTIDRTHEYEYGITKTYAATVEDWYLITDLTETSVTVKIMTGTREMRDVINTVDTGYITIKDKTTDTVILEPEAVDLTIPYLRVTNYVAVQNGQSFRGNFEVNVPLRNASKSEAYYKYEKITDENLINKYKEIKENDGDFIELESLLKKAPTSGYSNWGYWNGHDSTTGMNGFGYPTETASAPGEGLYYLWVYFSGENIKNLYGAILVDNLEGEDTDIPLVSISIPSTKTISLGDTTTLGISFSPTNATNKIVTWSSSDESVVTVNNAGKITAKKVGSAIITVVSEDGNKKATCTVTVTASQSSESSSNTSTESTTKYDNHTYDIVEKTMSWKEAKAYCENKDGYLVTITSEEEQSIIDSYIKEKGLSNYRFWIGAYSTNNKWKWVTGEDFDYANWGDGQPDEKDQSYANVHGYEAKYNGKTTKIGQWDNIENEGDSNKNIYFICEYGKVNTEVGKDQPLDESPQTGAKTYIVASVITLSILSTTLYFLKKKNLIKNI